MRFKASWLPQSSQFQSSHIQAERKASFTSSKMSKFTLWVQSFLSSFFLKKFYLTWAPPHTNNIARCSTLSLSPPPSLSGPLGSVSRVSLLAILSLVAGGLLLLLLPALAANIQHGLRGRLWWVWFTRGWNRGGIDNISSHILLS